MIVAVLVVVDMKAPKARGGHVKKLRVLDLR